MRERGRAHVSHYYLKSPRFDLKIFSASSLFPTPVTRWQEQLKADKVQGDTISNPVLVICPKPRPYSLNGGLTFALLKSFCTVEGYFRTVGVTSRIAQYLSKLLSG